MVEEISCLHRPVFPQVGRGYFHAVARNNRSGSSQSPRGQFSAITINVS